MNKKESDLIDQNNQLVEKVRALTGELEKVQLALEQSINENKKHIGLIESVYNSVPGVLYLFDQDDKLIKWNKKLEILTGYSADELLNTNIYNWVVDDVVSLQTIQAAIDTMNSSGVAEIDVSLRKKNGSTIPMHFTTNRISIDGEVFFTGIGVDMTESQYAEEELKTNYALLKVAGETARFGGWSYNIHDKQLSWSDSVRQIHEAPDDYIPNVNDGIGFYSAECQEIITKAFDKCVKKGIPYDVELQIVTAKENKIWIRTTGEAVRDEKGHVYKIQGSLQDINDRKIINLALKESERQLSRLIGNLPGFVYRCANDQNWTMYYISDVCEKITGYKPDDFINNNKIAFNDIIHPDFRVELQTDWEVKLKENRTFEHEYKIITASGEERWVWEQGIGVFDEAGKLSHLEGFIRDTTARKNDQEALFLSESKFRMLFSEMTDLAMFCKIKYNDSGEIEDVIITDLNEAFANKFNISVREDVIGKNPSEVIGEDPLPYFNEVLEAVLQGETYSFIAYLSLIEKHFQITAVPLEFGNFAILATDITELTNFNNILIEKNKELENYVYITSHDLRSPLVNIQGFSSRLKKHTDRIGVLLKDCDLDDEKMTSLNECINTKIPLTLDFIFNNVNKMEVMLNGLLQLSRTGRIAMNIHQVNMHELISRIINSVDFQLNEIAAQIELEDMPDCYGDESLLNQLFSNLISNAIKYRDETKCLKIQISGVMRYRKVQYRIVDNGIGISKSKTQRIWDVFYRGDVKDISGEGIGLSVVKRIVEKHHGKIWVESTEQVGSTFFLELPAESFKE